MEVQILWTRSHRQDRVMAGDSDRRHVTTDVKRNPENRISALETNQVLHLRQMKLKIYFFHFHQRNNIKITKGRIKLIHSLFNVECLQKFSLNSQLWPAKKSYYKI